MSLKGALRIGRMIFYKSSDPAAPAGDWDPVMQEDVPGELKMPDTVGRMRDEQLIAKDPNGVDWYRAEILYEER